MNEPQMLTALQNLLIARTWTGGSNVVFPEGCVIITPNLEEGLRGMLDRVGARTPICLIAPEAADSDPEHDEEPDLQKFAFSVAICVTVPGGAIGQETVMGANIPDSTKSEGQGILAVEQEFFNAVGKLNALEGVIIQSIQRSEGGGSFKVPLTSTSYRVYRIEAWGTIGDTTSSTAPTGVTTVTVRKTANQTNTDGVIGDITGLSFSVVGGTTYYFKFLILFSSTSLTTGLKLALSIPSITTFSANARIPLSSDGIGAMWMGAMTSSGDAVTATGVPATGTVYLAIIEGLLVPTGNSTLQARFASETAAAGTVTVYANSSALMTTIT